MDFVFVNRQFERIGVVDNANAIWTSRYYQCGDFQLIIPATNYNISLLTQSYYIVRDDHKDNIGVIEDYQFSYTTSDGSLITIVGRLSPMVLGKRIISQQTQLYGNVQDAIRSLVTTNVINPTKVSRKISCVALGEENPEISAIINLQTTGDNLLTKIEEICKSCGIGFKMPFRDETLYFELYSGVDRSYNQNENSWVVFSDEYDNLTNSEYVYSTTDYKNVFLIATEGEGLERKQLWGSADDNEDGITDLDRNEVYVDQRNMSSNDEDITEEEYYEQMNNEGKENLVYITQAFSGSVILTSYKYGKQEDGGDFYLGDIVTIKNNKWGIFINARVIEVIESQDQNGKVITLTFGI